MDTGLGPEQAALAEKIHMAGTSLLGVLNDILDYSKIEAGELRLESVPVDLEGLLEKSRLIFAHQAKDKGLFLRAELGAPWSSPAPAKVPKMLKGDPLRLLQIINNLTGNALKFTRQGGVTLRLTLEEPETPETPRKQKIRFEVRDTGIGLTAAQKEKAFAAFQQADASTSRKYGGTGLGLSISKAARFGSRPIWRGQGQSRDDAGQLGSGRIPKDPSPATGRGSFFAAPKAGAKAEYS